MKPNPFSLFSAILMALPVSATAQIFSWESDLEGWSAGSPNSVATSTIGATDGLQSMVISQPMSNMWYSTPTGVGLSTTQLQSIFTNATELKLDVSYPDPGYNSWVGTPTVEVIIQGANQSWIGLGEKAIAVGAAPQTVTFPLTVAQAGGMASSAWGQIVLKFTYGNGGSTATNAVFYVDNFTNTVVTDPPPVSTVFWKGDVDNSWASLNWTSDLAGTIAGGALPVDGTAGVAFAATDGINLFTDLGAAQNVKSVVVTDGVGPVGISGVDSLTLGSDGIWLAETAGGLTIDTTGGVVLGADQTWKNKSPNLLTVDSAISGSGKLTKSGVGPVLLNSANSHTGGVVVQQGTLTLGDAGALGGASTSLVMEGGTLDLNGLSPTIGTLSGNAGVSIQNFTATPCTLTLDASTSPSSYTCSIIDGPGGGAVSVIKKGAENVTATNGSFFTGNMIIQEGQFIATAINWGPPTWSSFGAAQVGGRTVTVQSAGSVLFDNWNIFGNGTGDHSLLPEFILNGSTLGSNRYNLLGKVTLNEGTLIHNSTDSGAYAGLQFRGEVVVTGASASNILSGNGKGYHLSTATTFTVADVTGDSLEDLNVFAPLIDQSADFASAAGGLIKNGVGTMVLQSPCTYTGNTVVNAGVLSLQAPSLSDTGALEVAGGATIHLNFLDSDTVGSLVLSGVPQADGIYGAINSGAEFESSQITGDGFIIVAAPADPFSDWLASYPSLVGPDAARGADPDGDGLTNIQEFAFNSSPENGAPSGKIQSSMQTISAEKALVLTLPVRDGATFSGTAPAAATLVDELLEYRIEGTNNLVTFDQAVSEVVPAASSGLPALDAGWTYRSFRLNGNVGGATPRGPSGFLRAVVVDTP
jgi:autotransporter-associated beta strand protein